MPEYTVSIRWSPAMRHLRAIHRIVEETLELIPDWQIVERDRLLGELDALTNRLKADLRITPSPRSPANE